MAEVDEAAYAGRLKAFHADAELVNRLKEFLDDLVAFKKESARRRLLETAAHFYEFYMSSVYFSAEQVHALLSFQRSDGLTLQQALESAVARKVQHARKGSRSSFELCTSHVLAPVFQDHFRWRPGTQIGAGADGLHSKTVAKPHRKNHRNPSAQC